MTRDQDPDAQPRRRLLLAGSVGPERLPVQPDPSIPDWQEPPHVRDPRGARERLVSQLVAGADIIVAPTWQTHRRALLPVGETRRARAWTVAAVRLAREAVESGLERRTEAVPAPSTAEPAPDALGSAPLASERPTPLVAASLPALDQTPETGTGRLWPREAASQHDYHDQAGLLSDAEPDLLLVEGQATLAELRLALEAAGSVGLPTWVALPWVPAAHQLQPLLDLVSESGVQLTLYPSAVEPASPLPGLDFGLLPAVHGGGAADAATAWLEAGAHAIGLLDGATASALAPLRAAIDAWERIASRAYEERERRRWQHVRRAAALAPGGPALWLTDVASAAPPVQQLPGGFDWLLIPAHEAVRLPSRHFRLVVIPGAAAGGPGGLGRWSELLEHGGILALGGSDEALSGTDRSAAGLRLLEVDDSGVPRLTLLRREA